MNVLLTGATGFVGRYLVNALAADCRHTATAAVRRNTELLRVPQVCINSLESDGDYSAALAEQQVVIHAAARAHILKAEPKDQLDEYRKVNVEGTLNLARQAAQAGVRRFVFISSIGVNGNKNTVPFTERNIPQPAEDYARSKWEAEERLKELSKETGMELVIIRPPLVYGPDAPGNFGLLIKVATKGVPLPLAGISNRRSFVSVWNLVDFIVRSIDHPAAVGKTFLVSDGTDISTTELLRKLAYAAGKPSRLFWLPSPLLKLGATALGKRGIYDRLFDSLQVDVNYALRTLDWVPPVGLNEGLQRCFYHQNENLTP